MDKTGDQKRLVVIDGKSVFYRGFYAMPNLRTYDGIPTGGVYGFATMALEVIRRLKPDYVAVAWDKPKTNIRKRLKIYPEYKAGRKPAPPEFYAQIPILHELLDALGWPLYELDDYEADDIMGSLAVQAKDKNIETILITSDLDMLQVVNSHVKVYALKTGLSNIELYSSQSFESKYGIKVNQFLDLKSLKGDSSDNIPGVPGIGEKTAIELLKQFKSLDGVYSNLDLIRPSIKDKLIAGKDLAYLSKKLASIWTDAPIKLNLKDVNGSKIKPEILENLLNRLQFRSLTAKFIELIPNFKLSYSGSNNYQELPKIKNNIIDSDHLLRSLTINNTDKAWYTYSFSLEKHGENPQVLILSDGLIAYTFDIPKLNKLELAIALTGIKSIIGYDLKSELKILMEIGLSKLPEVKHDIMIGAFLINSLPQEQSLTQLADIQLGYGYSFEDLKSQEIIDKTSEIITVIKKIYEQQLKDLDKLPIIERD